MTTTWSSISSSQRAVIDIPQITLDWSPWHPWDEVKKKVADGGVRVPNKKPGVYEARLAGSSDSLTIGRASNLRHRVKQGLVRGIAPHSSGEDIRAKEDVSKVEIRWAPTDRPAAAEEELHHDYRLRHGGVMPKYTDRT